MKSLKMSIRRSGKELVKIGVRFSRGETLKEE